MADTTSTDEHGSHRHFVDLHRQTRDEMFDRIECDNLRCEWPVDAHAWFDTVVNWVADIHLGADDPVE